MKSIVQQHFWESRPYASEHVTVELLKVKCLPVLLHGLDVYSLTKAQIKSLDYAVSFCYRKIFNVKSNDNVRLCMDTLTVMTIADFIFCESKTVIVFGYCIYCMDMFKGTLHSKLTLGFS